MFIEWSKQFNAENIKTYVEDLITIYSWVENKDGISSADWASISWLFIDNESRFFSADEVYWSSAFNNMSIEDYATIKSILHRAELKTLALQECGELIRTFKLKTDNSIDIAWTNINSIETLPANTLLDWMEKDGNFSDFLEKYTLKASKNGQWSISEVGDTQIFDGSEKELKTYLNSNEGLKLLFTELDESLCSNNRNKIGLLQGDKLLKAIIESKVFDQDLAILLPSSLSWEQLSNLITNLSEFNLKTGIAYDANSPEHIAYSGANFTPIPVKVDTRFRSKLYT